VSLNTEMQVSQENENQQAVNSPGAPGTAARQGEAVSTTSDFRPGILTESQIETLLLLGEEPQDYRQRMGALLEDLQPRPGLESHLVEQMGETFWRMRRAHRMRDGLALKSIQKRVQMEQFVATTQAAKAFEAVEPFERLKEALARRDDGPTKAEIDEFVKTRTGEPSEPMQEFIALLKSLRQPMEEPQRKAARREARKQLARLMEPHENVAWRFGRISEKVQSAENLAALMAPDDERSTQLQRLEDAYLRRMWRLINALGKVRQGVLEKKDVKKIRPKPECI